MLCRGWQSCLIPAYRWLVWATKRKVEPVEDYEAALAREIDEETVSTMISCGVFGYQKSWEDTKPDKVSYNLRYWAVVRPEDKPVNNPAEKALERIIVDMKDAVQKLGWGEKGKILVDNALSAIREKNISQ